MTEEPRGGFEMTQNGVDFQASFPQPAVVWQRSWWFGKARDWVDLDMIVIVLKHAHHARSPSKGCLELMPDAWWGMGRWGRKVWKRKGKGKRKGGVVPRSKIH
jgi:hypothetical protein